MTVEEVKPFSAQLKQYRKRAALMQEALAARAGLGSNTISNIERGASQPYQDTVRLLAAALDLTTEETVSFVHAARRERSEASLAHPDDGATTRDMGSEDGRLAAVGMLGPEGPAPRRGRRQVWRRRVILGAAMVILCAFGAVRVLGGGSHQTAPRLRVDGGAARGWPVLHTGNRETAVDALQFLLNAYTPGYNLVVDGVFGRTTRRAVQDFQRQNNLQADGDGVVGAQTWRSLTNQVVEHPGSRGAGVMALQYLLDQYPTAARLSHLSVDGDYGTHTRRAVDEVEGERGVRTGGVVTGDTWRFLICGVSPRCRRGTARGHARPAASPRSSGGLRRTHSPRSMMRVVSL